jgi:hypothetical protein
VVTIVNKGEALLLITMLAVSSLMLVESASAQSAPKPSVPEFTVTFADHSYDVAPSTRSTTNPYNNKTTTTTIPGYPVQNYTIDLTIKNQPYPATIDGNTSYLLYDVRMKGHYTNAWIENNPGTYLPHQSSSEYTVLSFPASYSAGNELGRYSSGDEVARYRAGDEVDFQIRAILAYGYNFSLTAVYPVYSYDYIFVALSDWSPTQTFTMPDTSTLNSSSTTSTPDQTTDSAFGLSWGEITIIVLLSVIALLLVVVISLRKSNKRQNSQSVTKN